MEEVEGERIGERDKVRLIEGYLEHKRKWIQE